MQNNENILRLVENIKNKVTRPVRIMEVCGTHTMSIAKYGLKQLLPPEITLLSGPGCPVCVTDQSEIDLALELSLLPKVTLFTFGDMFRVPGTKGSLEDMQASGAHIHIAFSSLDALRYAMMNPQEEVVFLGVGFETTAPTVGVTLKQAQQNNINNFSILSLHKKIVPVLENLSSQKDTLLDGFLLPGHVSTIIGKAPYEDLAQKWHKACVITGFSPEDILTGIAQLLKQINSENFEIGLQYKRGVAKEGNTSAQAYLKEYFQTSDVIWRGMGLIPHSGLAIDPHYAFYDSCIRFSQQHLPQGKTRSPKLCICGDILAGRKNPPQCLLFGKDCTPDHPVGPCMVSSEGSCAACYYYGR